MNCIMGYLEVSFLDELYHILGLRGVIMHEHKLVIYFEDGCLYKVRLKTDVKCVWVRFELCIPL